jgi:hypothetical protein
MKYFFLLLLLPLTLFAEVVEHEDINFTVKPNELLKGELHYSFKLLSPEKIRSKLPLFKDIDSVKLLKKKESKVILAKTVSLLHKPAGFFDNGMISNMNFLNHMMGEQTLKRVEENVYQVQVPGSQKHNYKLMIHFDSDDISSLPHYRVIHAVSTFKKLDVLSAGASSIMMKEMSEYSNYLTGAVVISSFVPLRQNETIMISYHLIGVQIPYAKKAVLERNFIEEVRSQMRLIESF